MEELKEKKVETEIEKEIDRRVDELLHTPKKDGETEEGSEEEGQDLLEGEEEKKE